ncbi:MAG: VTT domain-containing protein, partial [Tepidisphaeraceae bacterium]
MDDAPTIPASGTALAASHHRGLGRAGPVAVVAIVLPVIGSVAMLVLGPFIAGWLYERGNWGLLYFTVGFAVLGAVMLAPTYTTSIVAGWTFGFARGFPAIVVGTVGGAVLCYLGARWWARPRVTATFRDHPKWDVVRRAMVEAGAFKTLWIVFLLRLSPVLPFGTTNVLLA